MAEMKICDMCGALDVYIDKTVEDSHSGLVDCELCQVCGRKVLGFITTNKKEDL